MADQAMIERVESLRGVDGLRAETADIICEAIVNARGAEHGFLQFW